MSGRDMRRVHGLRQPPSYSLSVLDGGIVVSFGLAVGPMDPERYPSFHAAIAWLQHVRDYTLLASAREALVLARAEAETDIPGCWPVPPNPTDRALLVTPLLWGIMAMEAMMQDDFGNPETPEDTDALPVLQAWRAALTDGTDPANLWRVEAAALRAFSATGRTLVLSIMEPHCS